MMQVESEKKLKVFRCLNCGFVFKTPEIKWVPRGDLNPGKLYAIAPEALYVPMAVCPRCKSDAIVEVEK